MVTAALIPARKGSKGLPGKNLRVICGKPLIDYTILTALEILDPSLILVSSDCKDIINRGKNFGTNTIIRPNELATDNSPIIDTIFHAINCSFQKSDQKVESIILLQPTFPIRNTFELKEAIKLFEDKNLSSLVSVTKMKEHPSECVSIYNNDQSKWNFLVDPNDSTNRQDYIGDHFFISGNFYIADIEYLKKNKGFFSQETRFFETNNIYSVDIDNQEDFNYAKYCLEMINKS